MKSNDESFEQRDNNKFYWKNPNANVKRLGSHENDSLSNDITNDVVNIQKSQDFLNRSLLDKKEQYIKKYDCYPRHMGYLLGLYVKDSPAYSGS